MRLSLNSSPLYLSRNRVSIREEAFIREGRLLKIRKLREAFIRTGAFIRE